MLLATAGGVTKRDAKLATNAALGVEGRTSMVPASTKRCAARALDARAPNASVDGAARAC